MPIPPILELALVSPRLRPLAAPMHVLLAEDDADLRAMIAESLRADGHRVTEVANGVELLEATTHDRLETAAFDVIVSDVAMPGVSGMAVLARLAREPLAPPVVLMTAFGDPDLHAWARDLRAVTTFDKPFDVDDLKTVLINVRAKSMARGSGAPES